MNRILIKNGTLVILDKQDNIVLKQADLLIEDNIIAKIEPDIKVGQCRQIDAKGQIVLPGLINMHTHLPMSIFRETVDGYRLDQWLTKKIWPAEDMLTSHDIYYATKLSCIEAIKSGTTTLNDMYFFIDEEIKATIECGVRFVGNRTLMDVAGSIDGEARVKEMLELIDKYQYYSNLVDVFMEIHGLYTSTPGYIERITNIARDRHLKVHIHFCEDENEVETIKLRYNVNDPALVLKKYFYDLKLILAHCTKVTNKDIDILKELDVAVVHNPISNLRLGCGVAPVKQMLDKGINVCLGTDGQGSGSSLDMFEAMKFTALLQKGMTQDPTVLPAQQVIKMATIHAAKALGKEDILGSIEVGKLADIIIVGMEDISKQPLNDVLSNIVYNTSGRDVITTIVNGKVLMENKELLIDEQEVIKNCKETIKRIMR